MAEKMQVKEALPKKQEASRIKISATPARALPDKPTVKAKVTKRTVKRALPK